MARILTMTKGNDVERTGQLREVITGETSEYQEHHRLHMIQVDPCRGFNCIKLQAATHATNGWLTKSKTKVLDLNPNATSVLGWLV